MKIVLRPYQPTITAYNYIQKSSSPQLYPTVTSKKQVTQPTFTNQNSPQLHPKSKTENDPTSKTERSPSDPSFTHILLTLFLIDFLSSREEKLPNTEETSEEVQQPTFDPAVVAHWSPAMSLRNRSNSSSIRRTVSLPIPFVESSARPVEEAVPSSDPWEEEKRVWLVCLVFRAVNGLMVQTYFNPDEHWQALEVAHRITFGYGHLTWEWKEGIRSYLHPLIFALLYKILAFLHLDTPIFMAKAPRILQSVFASFGDLYLYKLSKLIFNKNVANWTLFCQMVNWFIFFCITRTLSNSLETVLTTIGLFYWFYAISSSEKSKIASRKVALILAFLSCAIRPTSAIICLYVGLMDLLQIRSKFKFIFLEVIPVGCFVLALTSLLDRWMYNTWVIVPLNFLKFNFLSSGGDYYGTHVFHWYFTQGFPSMIWTFLPFSVFGIIKSKEKRLSGLIGWMLGLYSLLGHKEFRFVLPVLPIALMFAGYFLASMEKKNNSSYTKNKSGSCLNFSKLKIAVVFLLITNVPMALYMTSFHQRGTEDVMYYLSKEAREGKVKDILFLMPCHSTPYYSSLHYNLTMRFLDCSPSESRGGPDESDQFMMNPYDFAKLMFINLSLPSHIVLFDSEERHLKELLSEHSFVEVKRFFHSHFKVDRDVRSSAVVYSHRD